MLRRRRRADRRLSAQSRSLLIKDFECAAVLGAGVIGASWTALFLAQGLKVEVFDRDKDVEAKVRGYVEQAWPALEALGLTKNGDSNNLRFHGPPADAVKDCQFVQECVPEKLEVKHALYGDIEAALAPDAIVASSASGLMVSEMQAGWRDPSRFLLGHPFNPPNLIPLVELLANERTGEGVLESAEAFYRQVGKVTIRINREVPGHVANRLPAALWREAIHLIRQGVATVEDVDKAVWAGPGLRWAAMGPTLLFHLGAGEGGLASFCERYSASFNRWWDDLGQLHIDAATARLLVDGVAEEVGDASPAELSAKRDDLILAMQQATRPLREG